HGALHLAGAVTDVTGDRLRAGLAAGSLTGLAEDGGIDFDIAVGAEDHVGEVESDADERVLAAPATRPWASGSRTAAAEEGLEHVAETAEAARAAEGAAVAAHVVALALLRIAQHVIG